VCMSVGMFVRGEEGEKERERTTERGRKRTTS
jgi:hypothetical protein